MRRAENPGFVPLVEYLFFWQNWISYPAKFWLVAAGGLLAFACGLAGLFLRGKALLHRIAWLALAATLVLLGSAAYDWYRFEYIQHGVIVSDETIARKGNSETYSPAFTQPLAEGTEFRVVQRRDPWLLIRLDRNQEGWIRSSNAVTY